jgi:hypothetical protein
MDESNMYVLYSTFFIWFLSWNLIENILTYYNVSPINRIKIFAVLLILAIMNYLRMTDSNESKE